LEESAKKAIREVATQDTPGKGTMMGIMEVVSIHAKASSGEGCNQVPDHTSSGGGDTAKLARTPGNFAAKEKSDYVRDHKDVEAPLDIRKKESKYHRKKVTYGILEQQWK
jgi:hypothetical protein